MGIFVMETFWLSYPGSTYLRQDYLRQIYLFACHLSFLCLDHFLDHITANGTVLLRG